MDLSVYWSTPFKRANGDALSSSEIGGYLIRYRETDSDHYSLILITDPSVNQFVIRNVWGAQTTIEVAAFDKDGVYSNFNTALDNASHD